MRVTAGLTKEKIGEILKELFSIFAASFDKGEEFQKIIGLWMDHCVELKDFSCTNSVASRILAEPSRFPSLLENAYINQIFAQQKLELVRPKRILLMKDFLEKFPASPKWISVAKLLAQAQSDEGAARKSDELLELLEKIAKKTNLEEDVHRLLYFRFQSGDFSGVLSDPSWKRYVNSTSPVLEVYREAALALVKKSKETKSLASYRNAAKWFYLFSKDPEKRAIVRGGFVRYLLDAGMFDEAFLELLTTPQNERSFPEILAPAGDIWDGAISSAKLDRALKVAEAFKFKTALTRDLLGMLPTQEEAYSRSPSEREALVANLSVTRPDWVLEYARSKKAFLSVSERSSVALAFRISLNQRQLMYTEELSSILGPDYPFVGNQSQTLPVELRMNKISIPNFTGSSPKSQERLVAEAILGVRAVREGVAASLKGMSAEKKVRLLKRAADLETSVARMLLATPIPPGLNDSQINEYKKGLAGAAEEFEGQSVQFGKLMSEIEAGQKKQSEYIDSRTLEFVGSDRWPWPKVWFEDLLPVKAQLEGGNLVSALMLLDFYRPRRIRNDEDYFMIRTGILLNGKHANLALRNHLFNELEVNKQGAVISAWKLATETKSEMKSEAKQESES